MDSLNPQKLQSAADYIDTWLELNFDNSRIPAMQIAVMHNNELIYSRSFGYADLKTKTTLKKDHIFRIASHSKTFTSTAIMQLVESGKLNLDDRVSQHVSWFKSAKDKRVSQVTVRQLLNHTAGIIRDGTNSDFWQILRPFPNDNELKEFIADSKLIYDADERFKYSNFAFGYLGTVVEAVSGVPYREYVNKNIVERLGLQSTGPDLDDKAKKYLTSGYGIELFNQKRHCFEHIDTQALSSATGFYSTAEDVCKYFAAHFLGNDTLLSDKSKRQMQHGYWKADKNERYGLGLVNYKKKGWTIYGHSGGFPGFITNTQFDAKRKLVVSVLTNAYDGPAKKVCSSLINIIDTFQQDTDHIKSKVADHSKFAGRFYSTWGPTDIVCVGKKLFAIDPLWWTEFDDAEELTVINETTLKIEKANNYSSPGETITFDFDTNGKAKGITYAGRTMLPYELASSRGWFKGYDN